MKKILLILLLSTFVQTGYAEILFSPGLGYELDRSGQDTTSNKTLSTTILNVKIAYMFNDVALGIAYDSITLNTDPSTDYTSTGIYIGYLNGNWNIGLDYYITANHNINNSEFTGSGMAIHFGYMIDAGSWSIGPQFYYRSLSYDEDSNGSITPKRVFDSFNPQLQAWFRF